MTRGGAASAASATVARAYPAASPKSRLNFLRTAPRETSQYSMEPGWVMLSGSLSDTKLSLKDTAQPEVAGGPGHVSVVRQTECRLSRFPRQPLGPAGAPGRGFGNAFETRSNVSEPFAVPSGPRSGPAIASEPGLEGAP